MPDDPGRRTLPLTLTLTLPLTLTLTLTLTLPIALFDQVCLMALAACPSWGVRALFFGAHLGSNLPNPNPNPN